MRLHVARLVETMIAHDTSIRIEDIIYRIKVDPEVAKYLEPEDPTVRPGRCDIVSRIIADTIRAYAMNELSKD
jgi:hypothetical protein